LRANCWVVHSSNAVCGLGHLKYCINWWVSSLRYVRTPPPLPAAHFANHAKFHTRTEIFTRNRIFFFDKEIFLRTYTHSAQNISTKINFSTAKMMFTPVFVLKFYSTLRIKISPSSVYLIQPCRKVYFHRDAHTIPSSYHHIVTLTPSILRDEVVCFMSTQVLSYPTPPNEAAS